MGNETVKDGYSAIDADSLASELFSGSISVGEAIERLRTRLLDLSARNSLLNYRHPKRRCIQICGDLNVNMVFDRLFADGKSLLLKHVPEPEPNSYEGKRPEAKAHATRLGITTSFEFPPATSSPQGRRLHGLQTLLYPAELERQARKSAGEAKTAIEETGSNMLFLVFGFLEFYDSEDSDRAMLAPLLSLPAALVRGGINSETRTYQYYVSHNGEDLAENHTLREKLRRDFTLSLPEFGEEEEPESYFVRVENAIRNKRRWRVRRQITLGMLSFGKLAIWADLDTSKKPGLLKHPLIKSIFTGGTADSSSAFHAEDYEIDKITETTQPLIYDADSSQHSAIIDVLSGKNLVINGPPGTGKSQTITNVIAAALSQGKKVLFVSEKLAALEVVRHRLNHAGLGHFCLELHSHKSQKKKLLEDIEARIEENFPPPAQYQAKLATLQRQRGELGRYAELMGSRIGNGLGLTVNEVFWAVERRRQDLGEYSAVVNGIAFPDASKWTFDNIESRTAWLSGLADSYVAIGCFNFTHHWWGFRPNPLAPADDEKIGVIVINSLEAARKADSAAAEAVEFFSLRDQPDVHEAEKIRSLLEQIPPFPAAGDASLLPRMFDPVCDPTGEHSLHLLADVDAGTCKARGLLALASETLANSERVPAEEMEGIEARALGGLSEQMINVGIAEALERVIRLEHSVDMLINAAADSRAPYGPVDKSTIETFLNNAARVGRLGFGHFPVGVVASKVTAVKELEARLSKALSHIEDIAVRKGLPFDATLDDVAKLADPTGISGLLPDSSINEQNLAVARRLVGFPLAAKSIGELEDIRSRLAKEMAECAKSLAGCRVSVECFGLQFEATENGIREATAMATVAAEAPADLLEYRKPTFGRARTAQLIEKARKAIRSESERREALNLIFYMDTLPTLAELKSAVALLRRKDGFFAFFDSEWRMARKLYAGLAKEKRKTTGRERAEELAKLIEWIESRDSFIADPEYKECFGSLFRALDTDIDKISQLNEWYLRSHAALVACSGLTEKVDITSVSSDRLSELAAKAESVALDVDRLASVESVVRSILGADIAGFREAKASGWEQALKSLGGAIENLEKVIGFFSKIVVREVAPKDALRLMEARSELDASKDELAILLQSETLLREAGGEEWVQLANPPITNWKTALASILTTTHLVTETTEQASAFTSSQGTLTTAATFASVLAELDDAWSAVSRPATWNRFGDWVSFSDAASGAAVMARDILERLVPQANPLKSLGAIFQAYSAEAEAHQILSTFASSDAVRETFGNRYDGVNTDFKCLEDTHAWGRSVYSLELKTNIRRALLSADAQGVLDKALRLYQAIESETVAARSHIEELSQFGVFSWDEWQRQIRGSGGKDLPAEIRQRLEIAAAKLGDVLPWSKYLSIRQQTIEEGLADFIAPLETGNVPARLLASTFELAAFQSIGRAIYKSYPELSRFNGSSHDKIRADYRVLDSEIICITGRDFASRIDRAKRVPEGQRGALVGDYTEMHLLRREINKQRRHIPIRQLVKRAGRSLQELKPCFMMGPLSVAHYLEQGSLHFDLVVMDEASQLRPEEALGAIARGSQLVVVGDPKQLPPTSFFSRMLDSVDDEEEDEVPAATIKDEGDAGEKDTFLLRFRCRRSG